MQEKELRWKKKKIGIISCSSLNLLDSPSGAWTKVNISYLYKIQRERHLNQPSPPIKARQFSIGTENEPYAVAWLRENTNKEVKHCSEDFDDIVFIVTDWGLGCSPDVYEYDNAELASIIEIKCVTGSESINFYFSPTVSFDKKRLRAFDEHRAQLAGQLLCHPEIKSIQLLKYDPQIDEDEFDTRDVTDPSRGILFTYYRDEFGIYLDYMKNRVIKSNQVLDSGEDIQKAIYQKKN